MNSKKCCVPGCEDSGGTRQPLHLFPNPTKDSDRFAKWVLAIRGDIIGHNNEYIFKNRRVCHVHFEEKYCCRYGKLSNIALPTLNLSGPLSLPRFTLLANPMKQIQNLPSTSTSGLRNKLYGTLEPSNENTENIDPIHVNSAIAQEALNSKVSHISKTVLSVPAPGICVPAPTPRTRIKCMLKTQTEKTLHQKLIRMRVKLSKMRSKVKKNTASLKASKDFLNNPKFLKTMENLPSTARILISMQLREYKKKSKGRRFTLDEKMLALTLYKKSPKAYRFLRRVLILPATPALFKLIQKANLVPGINNNIFQQLKRSAENMKTHELLCILLFDEMSLSANLAYNERKDRVVGFVNNGMETIPEYADHAQVFMIRGLLKNYKQPISFTFSASATKGPELCRQIKENVSKLQEIGFTVVATICDQGSGNRQAIKMLVEENKRICLQSGMELRNNIFKINGQDIVPLYDTPHLIKCIRNNLITKDIHFTQGGKSKVAKWEHIQQLYIENPGYRGLRLIAKLTESHVNPQKIPKMKVKHATQVLSQTVGKNMGYLADKGILPSESKDTADVILIFDELFDSVNGSYRRKNHAKPLLGPVRATSIHHKVWTKTKRILKTMQYVCKRTGKIESVPTLKNWIWTLDNIVFLLKLLNSKHTINSVWMRHLNQDPIENFFGAVRSHGCRSNNPTAEKFESTFTTLLLNNMSSFHAVGTNCEEDFCQNLYALVLSDSYEPRTTSNLHQNIVITLVGLQNKEDPRILGPLQYLSGYFLYRAQKKIFKNCNECKTNLFSQEVVEYIKSRQFASGNWLSSPCEQLLISMSNLQDITYCVLKSNIHSLKIKSLIKTFIEIHINFDFIKCSKHRHELIKFLINISCRFYIHNYCKNINRILSGKRDCEDDEDNFAVQAKKMCRKSLKRKK